MPPKGPPEVARLARGGAGDAEGAANKQITQQMEQLLTHTRTHTIYVYMYICMYMYAHVYIYIYIYV